MPELPKPKTAPALLVAPTPPSNHTGVNVQKVCEKCGTTFVIPMEDKYKKMCGRRECFNKPSYHTGGTPRSAKCVAWLNYIVERDGIDIKRDGNVGELIIRYYDPSKKKWRVYYADGYCEENRTVYEFYGDYWHGNPKVFSPGDMNHRVTPPRTFGELYAETMLREKRIRQAGYRMEVIWEQDWDRLSSIVNPVLDAGANQ
jgi:hypothetical protein